MVIVLPLLLFTIYLSCCVKVVNEFERMLVFRLGRFEKVAGPGLMFLAYPVDVGIKVTVAELNQRIPGWQNLPKEALAERLQQTGFAQRTSVR